MLIDTAVKPHEMRDASLEAFEAILPTLADREWDVLRTLYGYLSFTGYADATGGELAEFSCVSVVSVRPRLTGLLKRGLIQSGSMRDSRVRAERRCHPVWPTLPFAAVVRAERERARRAANTPSA